MLGDTCDGCGKKHQFAARTDQLIIYPDFPHFNHIQAKCPECQMITTIFTDAETAVVVAGQGVYVLLFDTVHDHVEKSRREVDSTKVSAGREPTSVELNQLALDILKFEAGES